MLKGRSMTEIEAELNRQLSTKHDFLMPTSFLAFTVGGHLLNKQSGKSLPLTDHAHQQVAKFLDIPRQYYDRMLAGEPDLLASNVNRWLERQPPKTRRLVRTLDGQARAVLSDRYFPLDHLDLTRALVPSLTAAGCEIISAEVTEKRLYIKAVTPRITGEVKVGDRVQAGVLIQNSEVGCGRVEVSPLVYQLKCLNGLVINELSNTRHHVGRRASDDDIEANGIYSRETIMTDIAAFLLKARDCVKAALDQAVFSGIVGKMRAAAGEKLDNAEEAIEEITGRYSLTEDEGKAIRQNLVEGGDASRMGLIDAITLLAHKQNADYARAVELEAIGGELLWSR